MTSRSRVSPRSEQTGLDELLEKVLLVADAELDLQANAEAEASGPIIESRLDVGRGPVATMLVQRGTLKVGDAIVAGDAWGTGARAPQLQGREARTTRARATRSRSSASTGRRRPASSAAWSRTSGRPATAPRSAPSACAASSWPRARRAASASSTCSSRCRPARCSDLNLVVKGDVQGSVEAIAGELGKIQHAEVRVNVIHSGVGGITENDVMLAAASGGMVVGFNVRPNAETRALAEREGVEIRTYNVIYKLTEDIEQALVGMLTAVTTEETIGEAEVRETFRASRVGTIAGCMVTNGVIRRGANVRVVRDGTVVYTTTIDSLKRFQDDAREVQEGFECGLHLEKFDDVKVGDVLEVFETREIERTSLDEPASAAAS